MRFTLKHCEAGISPDCPGHASVDKFPNCLIGALYGNDADQTTGNVDGFGRWVGLYVDDQAVTVHHGDILVTVPAGTYAVLTEDEHGFIGFDLYDTAESAQAMFDAWETDYGIYCDQADMHEYAITSSTGRIGR